jgi:hypothetical protein
MGHQREDLGSDIVRSLKWVNESRPSDTQKKSVGCEKGPPVTTLVTQDMGGTTTVGRAKYQIVNCGCCSV